MNCTNDFKLVNDGQETQLDFKKCGCVAKLDKTLTYFHLFRRYIYMTFYYCNVYTQSKGNADLKKKTYHIYF